MLNWSVLSVLYSALTAIWFQTVHELVTVTLISITLYTVRAPYKCLLTAKFIWIRYGNLHSRGFPIRPEVAPNAISRGKDESAVSLVSYVKLTKLLGYSLLFSLVLWFLQHSTRSMEPCQSRRTRIYGIGNIPWSQLPRWHATSIFSISASRLTHSSEMTCWDATYTST